MPNARIKKKGQFDGAINLSLDSTCTAAILSRCVSPKSRGSARSTLALSPGQVQVYCKVALVYIR